MSNTTVNKVILMGRIGNEPQLLKVQNQRMWCFSVVTAEKVKKTHGVELYEEFHQVKINEHLVHSELLHKGKVVYVQGRLQTHHYYDDQHVKHYRAEVIAYSVELVDTNLLVI